MKEAAGEANLTVITIVLIGVVVAVGAVILPRILDNAQKKSCCTHNDGIWLGNKCYLLSSCDINEETGTPNSCTEQIRPTC